VEDAFAMFCEQRAGAWAFRAFLAQHGVLRIVENSAPLGFGLDDFEGFGAGRHRTPYAPQRSRAGEECNGGGAVLEESATVHGGTPLAAVYRLPAIKAKSTAVDAAMPPHYREKAAPHHIHG
jgi:hypothetical protein